VKGDVGIQESAFDDNDLSYEQDSKSKLSGCSWLSNETGADGSRKLIQIPFLTIMKNLKTIITNARIYHHSLFCFFTILILRSIHLLVYFGIFKFGNLCEGGI